MDHFLPAGADIERFDRMTIVELGDFVKGAYELKELKRDHRELQLQREGSLKVKKRFLPLTVTKRYRFTDHGIELEVGLSNPGKAALTVNYAMEVNLSLPAGVQPFAVSGDKRQDLGMERCEAAAIDSIQIRDPANKAALALTADVPFDLWCLPVETVTYQPAGRRRSYQGSCFVQRWSLSLEPGRLAKLSVALKLGSLPS
jgi:hypothetical protein